MGDLMSGKPKDITNKRYGKLVAKEKTQRKSGNCYIWKCECDCGNITYKPLDRLENGRVKSCGCLQHQYTDITGKTYGKLTAIKYVRTVKHKAIWSCKCECGKDVEVAYSDLASGNTTSCGCVSIANLKDMYVAGTNINKLLKPKLRRTNTSGVTGVSYNKKQSKWEAEIVFRKVRYKLGRYNNKEDAIMARKTAEDNLYGDFLEWYNEEILKKQQ